MAKTCLVCNKRSYSDYCVQHKPRKPIKTNKLPNKIGKVGRETAKAVAKWKASQHPNHQGYFKCYIGGEWISQFRGEHPYSKARHPELRTTQKFEIVCDDHNALKGSMDIDEFLMKYPQFQATVKKEYLPNL